MNATLAIVSVTALVAIAAAFSLDDARKWPRAEAFLAIASAAALWATGTEMAMLLRARRLSRVPVKLGTQRRKPRWMMLGEYAPVLSFGGVFGAVASALGLPTLGYVLFAAFVAFFFITLRIELASVDGLTFEPMGMRLRNRDADVFVPWHTIDRIERVGSGLYQTVRIRISDPSAVSSLPDTPASRAFVAALVQGPEHGGLVLAPWIGGLDAGTLVRTISNRARSVTAA
jgi:hypothetical protein